MELKNFYLIIKILQKELENSTEEIRVKSLKKDYKETGIKDNNDILDDDLTIIGIGTLK